MFMFGSAKLARTRRLRYRICWYLQEEGTRHGVQLPLRYRLLQLNTSKHSLHGIERSSFVLLLHNGLDKLSVLVKHLWVRGRARGRKYC